jgi:hypothetical protein
MLLRKRNKKTKATNDTPPKTPDDQTTAPSESSVPTATDASNAPVLPDQPEAMVLPTEVTIEEPPTLQPPTPVSTETKPNFAERVTRGRQPGIVPDPFAIAVDRQAGVHLFENRRERLMAIQFDKKPGAEVLERIKGDGFRWNSRDQVWTQPIRPESASRIRIEAERTYQDVRQMIRQEQGLGTSPEVPF